MRTVPRTIAFAAAIVAAVAMPTRSGRACGNEVYVRTDAGTRVVQRAEQLNNDGEYRAALQLLWHSFKPQAEPAGVGASAFNDRVELVRRLAFSRLDGKYGIDGEPQTTRGELGRDSLLTTLDVTNHYMKRDPTSPLAKAYHAEMLSRISGREAEARTMFEALEANGLLPSAQGYAALARLRARRGSSPVSAMVAALDAAPRQFAIAHCRTMTKAPEICSGEASPRAEAPVDKALLTKP